jgi:hypothetical protein
MLAHAGTTALQFGYFDAALHHVQWGASPPYGEV